MATESRNKRWNAGEAAEILDRADASGLSDSAFAKEAGITGQRVYWWREKLGRRRARVGQRSPKGGPAFVEVRAKKKRARAMPPQVADPTRSVEIRLENGRSLVVSESVSLGLLEGLLVAVEGGQC